MILPEDVKQVKETQGTPGGVTYEIRRKNEHDFVALCYRPLHKKPNTPKGARCSNTAGFDTWHLGTGACKFHGGSTATWNITTGRTAPVAREQLRQAIENYMQVDRKDLLDLTYQLATAKAIYDEFMEHFPTPTEENYGFQLSRFMAIIDNMSRLVDNISKIDNRNALTAAQVLYLRSCVADLLMKYLSDPLVREKAARELAARLGGDVEVTMVRSEFSLPGKSE